MQEEMKKMKDQLKKEIFDDKFLKDESQDINTAIKQI